ncbi:MAG: hypothetical protein AAFW46_08935 [Pseudomonadota bacterium]
MVHMMLNRFRAGATALLAAAATTLALAGPAAARDFQEVTIALDLATGAFDASVVIGGQTFPIESATQIQDGVFAKMDLSVALKDPAVAEGVRRRLESGFTDEPSGCTAGNYGPLDMEDGLRYFFETPTSEGRVLASFYPGNRSTHWANDAFCEYSEELGNGGAVLRITGYYFVIYRQIENAQYIQLRAVTLTPNETDALTNPAPGQ